MSNIQRAALAEPQEPVAGFKDWHDNAIWGNEDFKQGCERAWNAAVQHAPQPLREVELTDEDLRDALRSCPHDTVENLRVRWLYAKDFARAVIAAYKAKQGEQT